MKSKTTLVKELLKGEQFKYIDTFSSSILLFNIITECNKRLKDKNVIHIKDWNIAKVKDNLSISNKDIRIQISILDNIYYVSVGNCNYIIYRYGKDNYTTLNKILLEL